MAGDNGFHVEPQQLTKYAGQIDRNSGCFEPIINYLADNANNTDGLDGLLVEMRSVCMKLSQWQCNMLETMRTELYDSATALTHTADSYTHIGQQSAAKLDKTYSAGPKVPTGSRKAN